MASDHRAAPTVDLTAIPTAEWPRRLAVAHASLSVGAEVVISHDPTDRLADLVVGAGFDLVGSRGRRARVRRLRSLPDTVGPGMRLVACGLNPSLYAADTGVGYARPGNRFWPAALESGLVGRDRDAFDALEKHRLGMTDLVKRATRTAAEITRGEYEAGFARVARLIAWLRPGAVCFVGLAGFRAAVARHAVAGVNIDGIAGVPVYVMPSTSGVNASASRAALVYHLRAAAALADASLR
ncbi:MAG: mismatch-specific DNA-glycosylase [Acidimicrobiia bacterium]